MCTRSILATVLLMGSATTQAATLLVTVQTDSYDGICNLHCSLRDAVQVANQTAGPSTILLPPGTYGLTRPAQVDESGNPIEDQDNQIGDLDVAGELRIRGFTTTSSRIQGKYDLLDRLFEVLPGAKLSLENLTLEDSNSRYNGGAVANHGRLQLRSVLAQRNEVSSQVEEATGEEQRTGHGGAIANYGNLQVYDSRLQQNVASGFYVTGKGGAIFNSGSMLVRGSFFSDNDATEFTILGAGPGIYNTGNAAIENSTFYRNGILVEKRYKGGTITNDGGTLVLSNSTFNRNEAVLANGLSDSPDKPSKATLNNVTITLNTTQLPERYAVMNWSELVINNSLIAGNRNENSGSATNCHNFGTSFSYQAAGLLRNDETSNCGADSFVPLEQTFTLVLSSAPTKHSSLIWTHDLLPGSPAVDAAIGDCPARDQRGVARPQDGNGDGVAVCDLGAYELLP